MNTEREKGEDALDATIEDSFPASDPPSQTVTTGAGTPERDSSGGSATGATRETLPDWEAAPNGWMRTYDGMYLNIVETGEPESWLVSVSSGASTAERPVSGPASEAARQAIQLADEQAT